MLLFMLLISLVFQVEGDDPPTNSQNFAYTGGEQTYIVPSNVNSLQIDVCGAMGGPEESFPWSRTTSLNGDRVQSLIPVTPGQTGNTP